MMKHIKRLLAMIIAMAIFFTAIPASAFYEDEESVVLTEEQETDYSLTENDVVSFKLLILPQYESGTSYSFTYDGFGRTTATKVGNRTLSTYTYNSKGLTSSMNYGNGVTVSYGYDALNRQTEFYVNGTARYNYRYDGMSRLSTRNLNNFFTEYTYLQGANANSTTTLVSSMKNGNDTLAYTYDELGNITSISKNGTLVESYTYDNLNQLKTVTKGTDTYTYNYDNGGNILSVTKNGATTKTYTYGDSEWKDLLTAYNGNAITYDNIGNPLNYYDGSTFTWSDGRKLTGVTKGTDNISYAYDSNGLRASKNVNGTVTEYYWLDSTLYAEKTGNQYIYFHYDDNGIAYGFTVNDGNTTTDYYYIHNLQGDVIGILDSNGTKVVEYTYDEWGKLLATTGTLATTIGELNPIRYRGYYYDAETEFYYCRARYYDPEICRFISPDTTSILTATPTALTDKNLYAYCDNNPIMRTDNGGDFWNFIAGAAVGAVFGAVGQITTNLLTGNKWNSGLGTSIMTGFASGVLAASGAGLVTSIVCNAGISMIGNATNQVIENKGFDNFDVGDMLADGAVGGISGAVGGSGMGKSANLKTLNKNLTKKVVSKSYNTVKSGVKYYISQTKTIYKKTLIEPIKNSTLATTIGNYLKKVFKR